MDDLDRLLRDDKAEDRAVVVGSPEYAALRTRDAARRERVAAVLAEGRGFSPRERFAAAWILNHGDTVEEALRAHELARQAAREGCRKARWLAAAALDRSLMYAGRPQRYGTNMVPDGVGYRLWDVDDKTTDDERAEWDVPSLAEMQQRAKELSARAPQPSLDEAPAWLRAAIKRWNSLS
ncbi:MAG TPA: hypothetical protein VGL73_06420 [Caulobacteraceae bacterium]|jgi:hypothetical protein